MKYDKETKELLKALQFILAGLAVAFLTILSVSLPDYMISIMAVGAVVLGWGLNVILKP